MYDNLPRVFWRKSAKIWNSTAKDCYNIKCNCSNCFIYNTYFKDTPDECMMKYYVKYLLMKIGKPKEEEIFTKENY